MATYTITEKQNMASYRKGYKIEADCLTSAKRKASRMQFFQGTVLVIEADNGALLASKANSKWTDYITP